MSKIRHEGTQNDLDSMAEESMIIIHQLLARQSPIVTVNWETFFNLANSYLLLYNKTMEKGILPPPSERGKSVRIH